MTRPRSRYPLLQTSNHAFEPDALLSFRASTKTTSSEPVELELPFENAFSTRASCRLGEVDNDLDGALSVTRALVHASLTGEVALELGVSSELEFDERLVCDLPVGHLEVNRAATIVGLASNVEGSAEPA